MRVAHAVYEGARVRVRARARVRFRVRVRVRVGVAFPGYHPVAPPHRHAAAC